MQIQDMNIWFDTIRKSTTYMKSTDPMEYNNENSSIISLPDHSRSPGDLIVLTAARISKEGFYDIYTRSLPGLKHFAASFSIPGEYLTQAHSHNYIELAYVLAGTMYIQFEDYIEKFETGEICLIERGFLHADFLKCDDTIILYLGIADVFFDEAFLTDSVSYISELFIRDIIMQKRMKHDFVRFYPKYATATIPHLYLNILDESYHLKPGYIRLIKGYCERILCLLSAEYQISLTNVERNEYLYYVYKDVKSYIEEHYASVTTTELSQVFGYNQDYFNRLIKRFSDRSYTQLLQSTRIKAASTLLETTELSIEKISQIVGYSNLGYFYRTFHATYGYTPGEYRANISHKH
ncbi:MAG: helix-turn-helix domain-containing protein, partial [Suipraeoptans sp.]